MLKRCDQNIFDNLKMFVIIKGVQVTDLKETNRSCFNCYICLYVDQWKYVNV